MCKIKVTYPRLDMEMFFIRLYTVNKGCKWDEKGEKNCLRYSQMERRNNEGKDNDIGKQV